MRLALGLEMWGRNAGLNMELVLEAERLGYDSVWAAEAWGNDAVTYMAWMAALTTEIHVGSAILQIPARTPATTAMTAATLSELSRGRLRLGLGVSGPQVVEGWHGVPYGRPLARTREYVAIVREMLARNGPVEFDGREYQIPYRGPEPGALGKPLMLGIRTAHPVPVYLAAMGPRNVALTAEIADGWLPVFYSPERAKDAFWPALERGFASAADPAKRERFDVAPRVAVSVGGDVAAARRAVRRTLAFYVGGMGARDTNFYLDLVSRYGYGNAARDIQERYLAGSRSAAVDAVPEELVDEVALAGSRSEISERMRAWEASGVTTVIATATDIATVRALAEIVAG